MEALPEEYEISMIDQNLYELCKSEIWTTDLVSQFPTYEDFRRLGIGVVICQNHTILSGASSYTRYRDGIEIQINTRDAGLYMRFQVNTGVFGTESISQLGRTEPGIGGAGRKTGLPLQPSLCCPGNSKLLIRLSPPQTRDILPPLHLLSYYPICIAIAIVGAGLTAV